jgi:hypothetical protein
MCLSYVISSTNPTQPKRKQTTSERGALRPSPDLSSTKTMNYRYEHDDFASAAQWNGRNALSDNGFEQGSDRISSTVGPGIDSTGDWPNDLSINIPQETKDPRPCISMHATVADYRNIVYYSPTVNPPTATYTSTVTAFTGNYTTGKPITENGQTGYYTTGDETTGYRATGCLYTGCQSTGHSPTGYSYTGHMYGSGTQSTLKEPEITGFFPHFSHPPFPLHALAHYCAILWSTM